MWIGGAGWHWFGKIWPVLFLILFIPAIIIHKKLGFEEVDRVVQFRKSL